MGEETEVAGSVPQVAFKKRSKGKANFRKKPATPPPASDSDSDFVSSDDEEGRRIKRRRKNAAVTASSTSNATRKQRAEDEPTTAVPAPLTSSNDATKASDWYDENLSEKNLLGKTRENPVSASQPDGTYKGAANYQSFIQKNPNAPGKFGPVKAATNVRTITVTDFAPDVCKDWKQTGYVSYAVASICLL
jgi:RING finger protein 113A